MRIVSDDLRAARTERPAPYAGAPAPRRFGGSARRAVGYRAALMALPAPPPPATPTVETPRLVLRGPTLADFEDLAAMMADPVVTKHLGGRPQPREEVWSRFLRLAGNWALLGYGPFVARERASGRFVGNVGYFNRERDIAPSFAGAPEAGWVLAAWAHGLGYATEGVRAATAWLEGRFGPTLGAREGRACHPDRGTWMPAPLAG